MMNILKNVDVGEALGLEIGASNIETGTVRTRQGLGNDYISMNEANINTANDAVTVPNVDLNITCKGAGAVKLMTAPLSLQTDVFIGRGEIKQGQANTTIISSEYKVGDIVFFSMLEKKDASNLNNGMNSMVFHENGSIDGEMLFVMRDAATGSQGAGTATAAGIDIPFTWVFFKSHA